MGKPARVFGAQVRGFICVRAFALTSASNLDIGSTSYKGGPSPKPQGVLACVQASKVVR